MITNEIIESFLRCDYKAYQKFNKEAGTKTEYEIFEIELFHLYKNKFYEMVRANTENQIISEFDLSEEKKIQGFMLFIEPFFQSKQFHISFEALEILPKKTSLSELSYTPIIISSKEKISQFEKLYLVIKCLILKEIKGILPEFGKIIYGYHLNSTKVAIATYLQEAQKKLNELIETLKNSKAPRFYQNNFCKICEFQAPCQAKLVEIDDLSLLGRISKKEIFKKNNRGIFSIYQLSYTFRPRKEKKGAIYKSQKILWELKALALREKRTYVREVPVFQDIKTATENGIKDYLVLLSIHQTCRYRGISFLDFLKSGEKSIEKYCRTH